MLKKIAAAFLFLSLTALVVALCFYAFFKDLPRFMVPAITLIILMIGLVQDKLVQFLGWRYKKKSRKRTDLEKRIGIDE